MTDARHKHPPRSASLGDSLEELLNRLEQGYERPRAAPGPEREPRLETGVSALDRLFGGFPTEMPTTIAVDRANTVGVLAATIARVCPSSCVIATANRAATTRWILAAEADVAVAIIESGLLCESDWEALSDANARLEHRPVILTESVGAAGLREAVETSGAAIVFVTDPERFGEDVEETISWLTRTFEHHHVATLVVVVGDTADADVAVLSTDRRGSQLAFMTPDPVDLIRRIDGTADPLTRRLETS